MWQGGTRASTRSLRPCPRPQTGTPRPDPPPRRVSGLLGSASTAWSADPKRRPAPAPRPRPSRRAPSAGPRGDARGHSVRGGTRRSWSQVPAPAPPPPPAPPRRGGRGPRRPGAQARTPCCGRCLALWLAPRFAALGAAGPRSPAVSAAPPPCPGRRGPPRAPRPGRPPCWAPWRWGAAWTRPPAPRLCAPSWSAATRSWTRPSCTATASPRASWAAWGSGWAAATAKVTLVLAPGPPARPLPRAGR